ncbi:DUF885 domain-containing protein [Sphingomonas sp. CFBP 13733]|uniref:DUF885 domain-containing protein n=1 Tax=Sphingomonas sp. CFBP 13733 TaxID=2775291 RepID=UPI001785ED57|nr:DUF885 family protein [Sphingomonas sp. CFBP 13733]MBD8639772.1 DUF885 family protein [Sphingomonas sp. CFBP 13733]
MNRRAFLSSASMLATLALVPRAALAAGATPGDAKLDALLTAIFDANLKYAPEFATQLGLDKGANAALKSRLGDYTPGAVRANLARTTRTIAQIEAVAPATLSDAGRLNREVVLYSQNQQRAAAERFGLGSPTNPYVISQQDGAYFDVPDFLDSAHVIRTAADADAYCARLDAFATALDGDTATQAERAKRGLVAPGFSLDLALGQMAALRAPAPAQSGLVTSVATRSKAAGLTGDWDRRATALVTDKVYPALDRQIALVKQLRTTARAEAGLWAVPGGDAIYAAALAQATTTNFTPDEVHKLGLDQVAQIGAELDTILKAQGLTKGSIGARLAAFNATPAQLYPDTPAGRTDLIAGLNTGLAAMQAKLPQAFINPPSAPLQIRAVPTDIQDGASNGYYRLAALDGSRPAIYFINLKSVADWPKYTLPSLTYHEGVPGHHLQLSLVAGLDTPLLRKFSFFGAYVEGWALYAEQLADELGGYAGPIERAGYLQSFLFRAARLVADTGLHAKRWTREQATDYFVDTVGFARPRSQREIERYCTMPGQACSYKLGHISWLRARDTAKKILGDKFDVKQFHEVLRDGAVPLTILERLVEARATALAKA